MADEFSEEEIRQELNTLGYRNVPPERLARLKSDLDMFVAMERSKNSSDYSTADVSSLQSSEYTTEHSDTRHASTRRYSDDYARTGNATGVFTTTNKTDDKNEAGLTDLSYKYRSGLNASDSNITNKATAHDAGEEYIREEIESSRITPDSDFGKSNNLRTFYVSVPERDLLTRYHSNDTNNDLNTTETSTSSAGEGKKMMKRKVLRKIDGEKHVDESITESETDDDVYGLMQRLTRLPLNECTNYQPKYTIPKRPYSAAQPSYRLPENYNGPKSLIRPITANPHTKNIKKTDPVNRLQMYQQSWNKHKRPEEKSHKCLRWNIREQMLYHNEVTKKSQRSYVPNDYVIPSDKKRKSLRWQIRQDMAEGVLPGSQWY